jgi:hypothetical protein
MLPAAVVDEFAFDDTVMVKEGEAGSVECPPKTISTSRWAMLSQTYGWEIY